MTLSTNSIRELVFGLDTLVETYGEKKVAAINLDNAATTPPFKAVMVEIENELKMYGSIGRGVGQKSTHSSDVYISGREKIKDFFGLDAHDENYIVIYTNNTTDGMNKPHPPFGMKNTPLLVSLTSSVQKLKLITKKDSRIFEKDLLLVRFVPMIGQ